MRAQILVMLLWFAAVVESGAVEPYPWIPGNRKAPDPVYPEILMGVDEALAAVQAGLLLPLDPVDGEALAGLVGVESLLLRGDDPEAAGSAFLTLERGGFPVPRILRDDEDVWAKIVSGKQRNTKTRSLSDLGGEHSEAIFIGRVAVREAFGREGFEIIDLRGLGTWGRSADPMGGRAGHIPHSLPYDFTDLLEDGRWPDPAEARGRFLELGPREREHVNPAATFILYGRNAEDARLGLAYLFFRMMDVRVRIYEGGWEDWCGDPESPVVRILQTAELEGLLRAENPDLADDFDYDSLIFLDLRGGFDFRRRHLPGAIPLPIHLFADSLSTLVDERWPNADRAEMPMVLYCYGFECVRSRNGANLAAHMGFKKLLWYREGVTGWKDAGLPVYRWERD